MAQIQYPDYQHLWDTMDMGIIAAKYAMYTAERIYENRTRYRSTAQEAEVPWEVVGIIHYREADLSWNTHLANGDSLASHTIHEPRGLPETGVPPFTWEEGAIAALNYDQMYLKPWNNLPNILRSIEEYNGTGYLKYHPYCLSPYLWSCSNHYTVGKYGSDGHFNPTLVDKQVGAAPLFRYLTDRTLGVRKD